MVSLTNIMLEGSEKFNDHSYNTWKQQMMTIFEHRYLDQIVLDKSSHLAISGAD